MVTSDVNFKVVGFIIETFYNAHFHLALALTLTTVYIMHAHYITTFALLSTAYNSHMIVCCCVSYSEKCTTKVIPKLCFQTPFLFPCTALTRQFLCSLLSREAIYFVQVTHGLDFIEV